MATISLPEEALWEALHSLSEPEQRRLKTHIKGVVLQWLYRTLLSMPAYSSDALLTAYIRRFPGKSPTTLRVYKHKLWLLIERFLPENTSILSKEIQIWQKLWLSVLFWQKGRIRLAEILWQQGMHMAIETGWYEIGLWGIFLMDLFERDLHRLSIAESVSHWTHALLLRLNQRYQALLDKLLFSESYLQSRSPRGIRLPFLPEEDPWAVYFRAYPLLYKQTTDLDFTGAIDTLSTVLVRLMAGVSHGTLYYRFIFILSVVNMGVLLMNAQELSLYEAWYSAWQHLRKNHHLTEDWFATLEQIALSTRLVYLVLGCRWAEAEQFYEAHQPTWSRLIFEGAGNISYRTGVAACIYLLLIIRKGQSQTTFQWILAVETWLEKENFTDYSYLWIIFLRWYQAYRSADLKWTRSWYRRLYRVWRVRFFHVPGWKFLLRVVRILSFPAMIDHFQRRRIERIIRWWDTHPEEKEAWIRSSQPFPVALFIESLREHKPIEALSPPVPLSSCLPADLRRRIVELINDIKALTA